MIVIDPVGTLGEIWPDERSDAVGEERVVATSSRNRTLGHPDDDYFVEFERKTGLERTDEDTIPKAAMASEVVGELECEGAPKRHR